jgi:hypothetical protein
MFSFGQFHRGVKAAYAAAPCSFISLRQHRAGSPAPTADLL